MSLFACPNGRVEAVECQPTGSAARRGGRPSPYAGIRIRVAGGPREGHLGTIVRLDAGMFFDVAFDDGTRHLLMRHLAVALDGSKLPSTIRRRSSRTSPAGRVAELHAAGHERVVVYRSMSGRVQVRPWHEQDVGPGLIGVYAKGVASSDIEKDVSA